ncbi:MAG: type IV toxin-antitoxin system AbiEi family antitoxin [Anaerolineae bacterium]|mgnify:CR=1 FL=1|nr:type IV toxin-antitoxin system AbiEi family antitoxin [Anaerolineae bacterium]
MTSKTLGPTGAHLLTALTESNRTVFSISDAQELLESSYDAAVKTVRRLVHAGWLVRLTAGRYAIVPLSSGDEATPQVNRYVIARELLHDTAYYVSHDSAMDIHNMLTRPVTTVIVTTPRRLADREILGVPYRFVYAPSSALWGSEPVWVTPYERVIVSDLERTILDGLARPDLCAGVSEVATGLWMRQDDFDWDRLASYVQKLETRAVAQRLGYLLELYGLGTPTIAEALQEMVGNSYARLDPLLADNGPYLARWRLRLNLEPETLQSIVRT